MKFHLIRRVLRLRAEHPEAFFGSYEPLDLGPDRVGFVRGGRIRVVVPLRPNDRVDAVPGDLLPRVSPGTLVAAVNSAYCRHDPRRLALSDSVRPRRCRGSKTCRSPIRATTRRRSERAFDSFYRHAAQLDVSLRALEAVEVFRRDADALRNDLRALTRARLRRRHAASPPGRRTTLRARRAPRCPAVVLRLAAEPRLIVAVAVIAASRISARSSSSR